MLWLKGRGTEKWELERAALIDKALGFSIFSTQTASLRHILQLMISITPDYISVGGNRHPAAADWDAQSGVLAFGADNNVALWDPSVRLPRSTGNISLKKRCTGDFAPGSLLFARRPH